MKYDFSGYATRNDLKCADGRTIRRDAFKDNDGQSVPLVWQHMHDDPANVLGHAVLENRKDGVYAYGTFNDTDAGQIAKALVQNGDVNALSIYANHLKQQNGNVLHGVIREVSLVLAGANPGALIDCPVVAHSDQEPDEAVIYTDDFISLSHSDEEAEEEEGEPTMKNPAEIYEEMTDEQKEAVAAIVGAAVDEALGDEDDDENEDDDDEEGATVKHNVFEDGAEYEGDVLSHDDMMAIFSDAKRYGSLKDAVIAHGIENIDILFPDAQLVGEVPEWVKRDDDWVQKFLNGVHHTPFAKIKSMAANITEDEARAKGYIKGKFKKEEVFTLLKRSTSSTTIYKKQKIDRDDMIDIKDFNVVMWVKAEMRAMLNEELARAALIGDGRNLADDDHISEECIRPIYKDSDFYSIKRTVDFASVSTASDAARAFIKAAVRARKAYKGSGNPILFTTEDMLTEMLLIEDVNGRVIYDSEAKLSNALRVKEIVTVPVMENVTRQSDSGVLHLQGIIVNLNDYNMGADKGGEVNMFDDFDIDYNAQKYLIETRCSGAMVKPYSAIVLESNAALPAEQ